MALSTEAAREHVRVWSERLRRFPKLANWPSHLFHAADVATAVEILATGCLICREDLPWIPCDVADQGALHNNPEAHGYVRFYFRPRNNFHLSTEGIKCLDDPYRRDAHMSIPVMLAFDAVAVLTLEGIGFSQGMLSKKRPIGSDIRFFRSIDFEGVYHDGPLAQDRLTEVQDKRMAEVVVPRVLPLTPYLRKVICRTSLDRRTLLYRLGSRAPEFAPLITVEQLPQSTFLHKALYLTEVSLREGALHLRLHLPPKPPRSGEYRVQVEHLVGQQTLEDWQGTVPADWLRFEVEVFQDRRGGVWRIHIEGVLAYEGPIPSETAVIR